MELTTAQLIEQLKEGEEAVSAAHPEISVTRCGHGVIWTDNKKPVTLSGGVLDAKWTVTPKVKTDEVQALEKMWYFLKVELEQMEKGLYDDNQVDVIHDIQKLVSEIESGEYFK